MTNEDLMIQMEYFKTELTKQADEVADLALKVEACIETFDSLIEDFTDFIHELDANEETDDDAEPDTASGATPATRPTRETD